MWRTAENGEIVLDRTSCMLVEAIRVWHGGKRNWHLMRREFNTMLGDEKGAWALGHFEDVMLAIATRGKRSLWVGEQGQSHPTPDEMLVLRGLAAVQRDEFDFLAIVLENLFPDYHRAEPAIDIMALARLMSQNGQQIGFYDDEDEDWIERPLVAMAAE
ncbi:hypothetical protein [Aestuariispira ectoiniformans]|uniref:hypothetical protein n=1 Tax=Aestuariispira ectoiniformans TaxID=2775080 RepID=UPI00223A8C67|nr:hypothetical protein [Aestuariispira ectoiniformans]